MSGVLGTAVARIADTGGLAVHRVAPLASVSRGPVPGVDIRVRVVPGAAVASAGGPAPAHAVGLMSGTVVVGTDWSALRRMAQAAALVAAAGPGVGLHVAGPLGLVGGGLAAVVVALAADARDMSTVGLLRRAIPPRRGRGRMASGGVAHLARGVAPPNALDALPAGPARHRVGARHAARLTHRPAGRPRVPAGR